MENTFRTYAPRAHKIGSDFVPCQTERSPNVNPFGTPFPIRSNPIQSVLTRFDRIGSDPIGLDRIGHQIERRMHECIQNLASGYPNIRDWLIFEKRLDFVAVAPDEAKSDHKKRGKQSTTYPLLTRLHSSLPCMVSQRSIFLWKQGCCGHKSTHEGHSRTISDSVPRP